MRIKEGRNFSRCIAIDTAQEDVRKRLRAKKGIPHDHVLGHTYFSDYSTTKSEGTKLSTAAIELGH